MWGGLSNNTLGNSSKCIASDGVCVEGLLSCSGLNEFEHGMIPVVQNLSHSDTPDEVFGWMLDLTIPWEFFAEEYRPKLVDGELVYHDKWRANFYRYDYFNNNTFDFELTAWSPTHDPSFHIPSKFGLVNLI